MCGIVGLFLKEDEHLNHLGEWFTPMLAKMGGRGLDSAGVAFYVDALPLGRHRVSLRHSDLDFDWSRLVQAAEVSGWSLSGPTTTVRDHAMFEIPAAESSAFVLWLSEAHPEVQPMGSGQRMQIFKGVGGPSELIDGMGLRDLRGTHAIGHTRMATESAVLFEGCHPFSTGPDLCLVHNGSLSNHNRLRDWLGRQGIQCASENDSEVAAAYLTWQLTSGTELREALTAALGDLDGFYTFAIGTEDGFAVLRDRIGCKPAVMAETDAYVAIASEYRALAHLPGADEAEVFEPKPGRVYVWERERV